MKTIIHYTLGALASLIAIPAFSTSLLIKTETPGYTMAEVALSTSCIFDDKGLLLTTHRVNGLYAKKNDIMSISVEPVKMMIAQAAAGKVKYPEVMIADAPATSYYAYQQLPNGRFKRVFLGQSMGSYETSVMNESSAATSLRSLMDAMCGD